MKIKTFARQGHKLIPIEAEITLLPGLPNIHIIGLPDTSIRESTRKIKSALKKQKFRFPRTQQVLVNLRPNHFKKTSHGIDLVIAAGILWATGQIELPDEKDFSVYGELTLDGKVIAPNDIADVETNTPVFTGQGHLPARQSFLQINELSEISKPERVMNEKVRSLFKRPELPKLSFPRKLARHLAVIAAGEHSTLFAGKMGAGKSTAAQAIQYLLASPNEEQAKEIEKNWRGKNVSWRPFVNPHHSSTLKSLVGGGSNLQLGQASLAHQGILLLDELLEFDARTLEALREACDHGQISLSALGRSHLAPARFLLLGTTNLCKCGHFTPRTPLECVCSNYQKKRYLSRLSGPFLDRFQMLIFTENFKSDSDPVGMDEILHWVLSAQNFAKHMRNKNPSGFALNYLMPPVFRSMRRKQAIIAVSRTCADLDSSESIRPKHLNEALSLCFQPFEEIFLS